jgi:hypothetical protein
VHSTIRSCLFSWMRWELTPPFTRCTPGPAEESERYVRWPVTVGGTPLSTLQHERKGNGAFSGRRGSDYRCRFRGLHRGGARTNVATTGADGGDGQPLGPQRSSRPGARRRAGLRATVPAALLPRPELKGKTFSKTKGTLRKVGARMFWWK